MNSNFQRSLALVLKHEGGWADHPKDPGGATMKGVTLENFRRYVKPGATKADLRKITDAQLASVYKQFYWDAVRGDLLPHGLDFAMFDFAVNSGPSRAVKYLQKILGLEQDGQIGPKTLAAIRIVSSIQLIGRLCDDRLAFLKRLDTWPTFGKGWTTRVVSVRQESLQIAAKAAGVVVTHPPKDAPQGPPVSTPAPKRSALIRIVDLVVTLLRIFIKK